MIEAVIENVPPGSSLGYALSQGAPLSQGGNSIGIRTTDGIVPADGGAAGGNYSAIVDPSTGADWINWDTGGPNPQTLAKSLSALPTAAPSVTALLAYTYNGSKGALDTPVVATATLTDTSAGVVLPSVAATYAPNAQAGGALTATTLLPPGVALEDVGSVLWEANIAGVLTTLGVQLGSLTNSTATLDIARLDGPFTDRGRQSAAIAATGSSYVHVSVSASLDDGSALNAPDLSVFLLLGDLETGTWQPAECQVNADGTLQVSLFVKGSGIAALAGQWQSGLWYMVWLRLTCGQLVKDVRVGRLLVVSF